MKPIRSIASPITRSSRLLLGAAVSVTLVSTASAVDDAKTWGSSATNFNLGTSWVGNNLPDSDDTAIFTQNPPSNQPNVTGPITIGGLQFTSTAQGVNLTSSTATDKLTLTRVGTGAFSVANTALISFRTSGTNTVAAPLVLGGGAGFTQHFGQAAGGTFAISGEISESGAGTNLRYIGNNASLAGIFNISGTNTYTGATTIGNGTQVTQVNISNNAALGTIAGGTTVASLSTLGISNNITVGNETLSLTGSGFGSIGALRNISGDNFYQGTATLAAAARINSDAGSLTFNTATNSITGTNQNLTLGGGGNGTIAGTITTGSGTLTKDGAGTWTLGGANTYTGNTVINAGALQAINGIGLNTASLLQLRGGVFQSSGTFTRNVTTSAGGVNWSTSSGGFAAKGGVLNVNLNGGTGGSLTWNGSSFVDSNNTLIFGSATADNLVDFQNALNLGTSGTNTRIITVNDNVSSSSDIARISGAISGDANQTLEKAGAGTLELTNANNYTGFTTVSNGTLQVNVNNALGTNAAGTSVSSGAALRLNAVNYSTAEALTINGTGVASGGAVVNSGTSTYAGQITAATNASINAGAGTLNLTGGVVKNGTTLTLTGGGIINVGTTGISGSNANSDLVVDGTTLNANVANDYNGPTFIRNGGIFNANVANALPTANGRTAVTMDSIGSGSSQLNLAASQSAASLTGAISSSVALAANTLTIGTASGSTTFAGTIGGTGGNLTKDDSSTQILTGTNTYTGLTSISGGTLRIGNNTATGSIANTSGVSLSNGSSLVYDRNNALSVGYAINGNGSLTQQGAGTLTLTVANGYTGLTTISGGTLQIGNNTATGSIANTLGVTNNGALIYNRSNALSVGYVINGNGSLTKEGGDTLTLTVANGYTGNTTVNAGTLEVALGGSTAAGSAVTVNNSASLIVDGTVNGTLTANSSTTIVSGSGSVGGAAIVNGALNPGNGLGVLGFDSSLTLGDDAVTTMEISGTTETRGTDYDGINVGGQITYNGTLSIALGTTSFGAGNYTFNLFDLFTSDTGDFDFVNLTGDNYAAMLTNVGAGVWQTTTNSNNESWTFTQGSGVLALNVVPEPSSAALLGALGMLAMLRRRR